MKKRITLIFLFLILLALSISSYAGDIIKVPSVQSIPGYNEMPKPLYDLVNFLNSDNVNRLTPFFYANRNIRLVKAVKSYRMASETSQAPEEFLDAVEVVTSSVQTPPFSELTVEYIPAEKMKADHYYLTIYYMSSINKSLYDKPVIIYIRYVPAEKSKFKDGYAQNQFIKWTEDIKNFKDEPKDNRFLVNIAGIPVIVRKKEVRVVARPSAYYTGKEDDIYSYYDSYEFIAGRFEIEVKGDELHKLILEKQTGLSGNSENDLTMSDICSSRDIEPLVNAIINYIKGFKEEKPSIEGFIDLKTNKSALIADGKDTCVFSGRLSTKDQKGLAGYKIKVSLLSDKFKLPPSEIITDKNGNFKYIFKTPTVKEVTELHEKTETQVTFKFTAINPETQKEAVSDTIVILLKSECGINIFIHDENGKPCGQEEINIIWFTESESNGKKITKFNEKKVLSNDSGICYLPLPFAVRAQVIFRDPDFLTFKQTGDVPFNCIILRTNIKDYSAYLIREIANFLKKAGFSQNEINEILNARINFEYPENNKTTYDAETKTININSKLYNYVSDLEGFQKDFPHEIGHLISDTILDRSGMYIKGIPVKGKWVGGAHNVWVPSEDQSEQLAFEEAEAHFFADLFNKSTGLTYDKDFLNSSKSSSSADSYLQNGNIIEGNIASFLRAYYMDNQPGYSISAPAIFKDFADTIRNYPNGVTRFTPSRTIEDFLDAKFYNNNPGYQYQGNLGLLAKDYRIKAQDIWRGDTQISQDIKAMSKIKVIHNGKEEDFYPDMKFNAGDIIEVPPNVKVTFQNYSSNYFSVLNKGDKQWVVLGPGKNIIQVDEDYSYLQVNYGKAQFINTGTLVLDPVTGLPVKISPEGTDFLVDVNEKKDADVTVINGKVLVEKTSDKQKVTVDKNQMLKIIPGKPLENPIEAVLDNKIWWIIPPEPKINTTLIPLVNNEYKLVSLSDNKIKISIPKDWGFEEKKDQLARLLAPDKNALIDIWAVKFDNDIKTEDYIKYIDQTEVGPEKDKSLSEKISQIPFKISGIDGYRCEYIKNEPNDKNIIFIGYFVFKDRCLYRFYCITYQKDKEKFKPIFESMIKSVVIK